MIISVCWGGGGGGGGEIENGERYESVSVPTRSRHLVR